MNLSFEMVFAIAASLGIVLLVVTFGLAKTPRKLQTKYYEEQWVELQSLCANDATWPLAVMNADKLVDHALIKRNFKGKTMGERLVSAQRSFSDNDSIWFAHKLRNRIAHEASHRLNQNDVKKALVGFRQALKDLGAL